MRFVVAQMGARRNYAVPVILEQAGMLERFYTDLAGNAGLGKWLVKYGRLLGCGALASRLAGRQIPLLIKSKTVTLPTGLLREHWEARFCKGAVAKRFRSQLRRSRAFGAAAIRRGFGQATHLYSMLGESGLLAGAARSRGLIAVTEVYILLSSERIVAEEQRRFPAWETAPADLEVIRGEFPEQRHWLREVDYAVCPSEIVRADLEENFGFGRGRSAVVPYGAGADWLRPSVRPTIGRILFVGTAGLRKGIQYLAQAARELRGKGRAYEFRVAGEVTQRIARLEACRHLAFLGRVPRESIWAEFAAADVFVLPSLAEGSAEATYEALAAGLPVITTASAGSVVRHGLEGWIVPERDAGALAAAIECVVENRELRGAMSIAARARSAEYTIERYGQKLVAALQALGK